MIIDTHCHYNLKPLAENWKTHWLEAQAKGVQKSIIVGTSVETSQLALNIANQEKNLFATIGLHPNYWQYLDIEVTNQVITTSISDLGLLLTTNKKLIGTKIVAVGETGLDYFRLDKKSPDFAKVKQTQLKSFKEHLMLATKHSLPLILHVRDSEIPEEKTIDNAYWDTLELIKEHLKNNSLQFIMHCFSGPTSYVTKMVKLGSYIGVAGNITYPSSESLRSILKEIPESRVLLETDAPFLPPKTYRGKKCEPWMITQTAQFLEKELSLNLKQIITNTHQLFPQL